MNIKLWLNIAVLKLKLSGCCSPRLDAEVLLSFVLRKDVSWIIRYSSFKILGHDLNKLNNLLKRRLNGEPIAYLVKKKEFWSLSFIVSKFTLIPRPETETLVECTLERLNNANYIDILDLGTGCGCIALTLASMNPNCNFIGVDCSKESIDVAKENARVLKFKNVKFFQSFWFSLIKKNFDVIVSNPPYISLNEISGLDRELLFEPFLALISADDGLSSIHYIIKNSRKYLRNMGWLLIEHSWMQRSRVQKLFKKYNFTNIMTYRDYSGNDRVTVGQKIDLK
ncbi:MAG: peptide chain release factor N(5)-glutamine methyltransferase [Buchnera aphidicola (Nurudea shiraii)]